MIYKHEELIRDFKADVKEQGITIKGAAAKMQMPRQNLYRYLYEQSNDEVAEKIIKFMKYDKKKYRG